MAIQPHESITTARETTAWGMRARGWPQHRIAAELGITQSGVSKVLDRIERRELARLAAEVERIKVVQDAQLSHIIEESLDAWHRSKTPKKRAASKRSVDGGDGDGDEVHTTEIVERDGDTNYLHAAMAALRDQRSLWGLDVAAALQEGAATIAELAQDLFGRGRTYESRSAQEDAAGRPGGAGPTGARGIERVPDGPEPVQRDHPLPGALLGPTE